MPKRIEWIDFAKGFVMIAVVWGHALTPDSPLNKFFFMFRMPFFFVMAGFLLNLEKWGGAENYKKFLSKIANRLLVPYYLAELSFLPIWFVVCHEFGFLRYSWGLTTIEPRDAVAAIFLGNGALILAPLWFLPTLFVAEMVFVRLFNRFGEVNLKFFSAVIICAVVGFFGGNFRVPMGADAALVVQIFLLAGILIRKYNLVERLDFKVCYALTVIILLVFHFNTTSIMGFRQYGNPALFYAGGIAGTLLVIKFSMLLAKGVRSFYEFMKNCGRQSLLILVLHTIIANLCYEFLAAINFLPQNFSATPVVIIFVTAAGVLIPLLIAKHFGKLPVLKIFCT